MEFRIRELRKRKGWNQLSLAYHADMSVSQISLIESGKRNPSAASLQAIADALGVEISDLFPAHKSPKGKKKRLSKAQQAEAARKLDQAPERPETERPRPVAKITESVDKEQPLVRWFVPEEEREEHRAILREQYPQGFREAEAEPEEERREARVETLLVV